jgi:hypothetical protein
MIVLAGLALLLPGLAWWAWFARRDEDPLVSLGNIVGISLAAAALLAEIVFFADSRFSAGGIILLLIVFITLIVLGILKNGLILPPRAWLGLAAGLAGFALLCAWRLFQARNLLLPNWVDSQHHYLIIRVILEKGGLPGNLSPYLAVPFYYHYGFHIVTALFTALGDLEIGRAMLVLGQILNAAISLSVFVLGKTLWKDWRPGALAALLVGVLTQMPAYYLTWGRYTLTTGLVLLPLAMAAALQSSRQPGKPRAWAALALLTGGILLHHYFAAFLLALFLGCLTLIKLLSRQGKLRSRLKSLRGVMIGGAVGLTSAAPWLLRLVRLSNLRAGVESRLPESLDALSQGKYILYLLGPGINYWLLGLALLGVFWALLHRKSPTLGVWTLLLALLTLPWSLVIRPFRPDHFAIMLFIPAALWVGWLLWRGAAWLARKARRPWLARALLAVIALGVLFLGISRTGNIINPVTRLVTRDDLDALDWAASHTPTEARFFINTAHWLNGLYRSVDGGGWLLPYAGRWALVPTVFYGFSNDPQITGTLTAWGASAGDIQGCSAEFWDLVEEADLDHIYLRRGVGGLQPAALSNCAGVALVYRNATVFIYRIQPPAN